MKPQHLQYPPYMKKVFIGFLVLLANTGYLLAFSHDNWFGAFNVILHPVLGAAVMIPFVRWGWYFLKYDARYGKPFGKNAGRFGYFFMVLTALSGIGLLAFALMGKAVGPLWHGIFGIFACLAMISSIRRAGYNISVDNIYSRAGRWGLVVFIATAVVLFLAHGLRRIFPSRDNLIFNRVEIPLTAADAAMNGAEGPFFPSAVETAGRDYLNVDFLSNSESCGSRGCHPDVVAQWQQSAHGHPVLQNWLYREGVEQVQQHDGNKMGNFCAGCHAPDLLVSGQAQEPIQELIRQNIHSQGVSCNACHAIDKVKGTTGNAAYRLRRSGLSFLNASNSPILFGLGKMITRLWPQAHRKAKLRPFHVEQSSEFCSSCHDIGLEKPLVEGEWYRGPDYFDSWRLSAFGGSPSLSFFDNVQPRGCVDCHMRPVPSTDAGSRNGLLHSHELNAMPAAVAESPIELAGFLRLSSAAQDTVMQIPKLSAAGNLERLRASADSARLEIVIYPRGVGHFLPLGLFEGKRIYLEVIIEDENGNMRLSRHITHFEEALKGHMLLKTREKIDKIDGLQPLQYISAGSAALVELPFPVDWLRGGRLRISTSLVRERLQPQAGNGFSTDRGESEKADSEIWAHSQWVIGGPKREARQTSRPAADEAKSWNLYAVACYLRGDEERALAAFARAASADPENLHYSVNLARIYLRIGHVDRAIDILQQALEANPENLQAHFFLGAAFKAKQNYAAARKHMRKVLRRYKQDVHVMFHLGEIYFLQKNYSRANRVLRQVVLRHPENALAHYLRMLANKNLGRFDKARYEADLYYRFAGRSIAAGTSKAFYEPRELLPPMFSHFRIAPHSVQVEKDSVSN